MPNPDKKTWDIKLVFVTKPCLKFWDLSLSSVHFTCTK